MLQINPYLTFDNKCREAMTFYHQCLGGELTIQTVGESGAKDHMPPETHNSIMHAALRKDGAILLMASDMIQGNEVKQGNNNALALICTSKEEIESCFKNLSAGGKVTSELKEEFWGATFGMLTDKYGFTWMLNFDKPKA